MQAPCSAEAASAVQGARKRIGHLSFYKKMKNIPENDI